MDLAKMRSELERQAGNVLPIEEDPCDDAEMMYDREGNPLIPAGATDIEPDTDIVEDRGSTSSHAAYSGYETEFDDWQEDFPCDWSVGGTVPTSAQQTDFDAELAQHGINGNSRELTEALYQIEGQLDAEIANRPDVFPQLGPVACESEVPLRELGIDPSGEPLATAQQEIDRALAFRRECYEEPPLRDLESDAPFGGRDIIFVHGFDGGALADRVLFDPGAMTTWPADESEFYSGYWKQRAEEYWAPHIERWLGKKQSSKLSRNRYLVTSWATSQWLPFGVHAVLRQISDAMIHGTGVENHRDETDTGAFCVNGCVIVTHSTGAPLADVAISLAHKTKTNWAWRAMLGDIGYISDHMRAQISFHGAFMGSPLAPPLVAVSTSIPQAAIICDLALLIVNNIFGLNVGGCSALSAIYESVLFDLMPRVMGSIWGQIIDDVPIPVLTVSGGSPTSDGIDAFAPRLTFLKHLLYFGFDDGVLTMNSQCAVTHSAAQSPSGFFIKPTIPDVIANAALQSYYMALIGGPSSLIHARAFDMAQPNVATSATLYLNQVVDRIFTPKFWEGPPNSYDTPYPRKWPYYNASSCLPTLQPSGMVNQIASHIPTIPFVGGWDARSKYNNHFSFLMSTADHSAGGSEPSDTGCYQQTIGVGLSCSMSDGRNDEEVRAITSASDLYNKGLVSSQMKTMQNEVMSGKFKQFKIFGKKFKFWYWKRHHQRLDGYENLIEGDYVYRYALCATVCS